MEDYDDPVYDELHAQILKLEQENEVLHNLLDANYRVAQKEVEKSTFGRMVDIMERLETERAI